jgi:hypothetical protein
METLSIKKHWDKRACHPIYSGFRLYVKDSREALLQITAFMLEMAVFCGMQLTEPDKRKCL